jgi:S1-C subfamily serine protease
MKFTQSYTTDAACFGGPANWQGTRFRLDNVSDGELTRLSDTATLKVGSGSLHGVGRLLIDLWNRGETTHDHLLRQNVLPVLAAEREREWMDGSPTQLHSAMRPVKVVSAESEVTGWGVQVSDDGLILVPNALGDTSSKTATFQVDVGRDDWRKARLVVRKRHLSVLRADIRERSSLKISPRSAAVGETVFVPAGMAWNDRITTAGIVATNHSFRVHDANVDAESKPEKLYEGLLLTNRPATDEFLGAPVTNMDGELIGLTLPQRVANSSHGYIVPVTDLLPIVRNPPIPVRP